MTTEETRPMKWPLGCWGPPRQHIISFENFLLNGKVAEDKLFCFYFIYFICVSFSLVVWVVRSFGRSVVRDSAEQRNNNKYEKVRRNEQIEGKEKKIHVAKWNWVALWTIPL